MLQRRGARSDDDYDDDYGDDHDDGDDDQDDGRQDTRTAGCFRSVVRDLMMIMMTTPTMMMMRRTIVIIKSSNILNLSLSKLRMDGCSPADSIQIKMQKS